MLRRCPADSSNELLRKGERGINQMSVERAYRWATCLTRAPSTKMEQYQNLKPFPAGHRALKTEKGFIWLCGSRRGAKSYFAVWHARRLHPMKKNDGAGGQKNVER